MNRLPFRSSSAPRRDPTRRKWKLLTSKISWKKRKVRSTTQLRISQTASIFLYPALNLYPPSHESSCSAEPRTPGGSLRGFRFRSWILAHQAIPTTWLSGPFFHHLFTWQKFLVFLFYLASLPCSLMSCPTPSLLCLWQSMVWGKSQIQFFNLEMKGLDDPWAHF